MKTMTDVASAFTVHLSAPGRQTERGVPSLQAKPSAVEVSQMRERMSGQAHWEGPLCTAAFLPPAGEQPGLLICQAAFCCISKQYIPILLSHQGACCHVCNALRLRSRDPSFFLPCP